MKNATIAVLLIVIVAGGATWYLERQRPAQAPVGTVIEKPIATSSSTTVATTAAQQNPQEVIGTSVDGRTILAYHFGSGQKELLFVAGIHGGYEWNTTLFSNDLIQYFQQHPEAVPANEEITVIPVLNPDGLAKVVANPASFSSADITASKATEAAARFNANQVDLNRNFDCNWKPTGVVNNATVSGGASPFSEPESQALEKYVTSHHITAAIVYFSSAGGVFASSCNAGVLPAAQTLVTTYANAAGYPAYQRYDFYALTGDAVNWLAKENIPAISVLLTNHTDPEWSKNLSGVIAVLNRYSRQ